ncbi:glycerate kinase [Rhinatrema bivittatum]|uniref:glycerate kinase n=1 Tax=Rhinatrema bivittatum TaxID=194408 RepID=UPI00112A4BEF|nr:glycerate kinase [Rhinatrema bivittatum]XP_029455347.1 glycerate kinase [Rhinatrema bivittatum]XP_029455348.1 glycerate kinase [Rhinatrema bivittatum]XP_029455350.1 glycerate kinase [Rhinatrema bivittatum]XP_029455351.1 glycerate kinase [Rhinatrema bivittatum]XP_029455352.1 glycerate kinase [Rhinatrema bivittatum]XP_029455353.1 glycerate kinase [Rhinatrema bivittatum]XP_029455354.1 glycerate kinase [Rhinatrema bivittatum]
MASRFKKLPFFSQAYVKKIFWWQNASRAREESRFCSMSLQEHGQQIFQSAVSAVMPEAMLKRSLRLVSEGSPRLTVGDLEFSIHRNLYLVGFGKAVLGMAAEVEKILGDHLVQGLVSVPLGIRASLQQAGRGKMLLKPDSAIKVMEGAEHNLPDEAALQAAVEIERLIKGLTANDLLLVLVSGGGSALLPAPIPPVTLEEKQTVTKLLASRGATIHELNTVRKGLSRLKGGGLARAAHPAQVLSLILSDVIGDSLDIIASGPTVLSSHSTRDCLQILGKYNLHQAMPMAVESVLQRPGSLPDPREFNHVHNVIVGSNSLALAQAKGRAQDLEYLPLILSAAVSGEVRKVSRFYSLLIQLVCSYLTGPEKEPQLERELLKLTAELQIPSLDLPGCLEMVKRSPAGRAVCLLAGGETTVQLQGEGKGGRNQELALRVALDLHRAGTTKAKCGRGRWDIVFLSGGTDGQDGPTEAAGAFSTPKLVEQAEQEGLEVEAFLSRNDSYTFFSKFQGGRSLLLTGLTGTNVMDIQVVLIRKRDSS